MTQIVVGVDGGGSKTHVIVADENGRTLGQATGGPSGITGRGIDASARAIADAVGTALAECEMADASPSALCAGIAGAGRDDEQNALRAALTELGVATEIAVVPDFQIALDDAFGAGPGLLLVCGTGSVAFGRSPAGNTMRCGGWGAVCGDEGSGAWIGRRALSMVTAAADGREPATALTGALLTAAEANEASELIAWAAEASPAMLATLAPVVFTVADGGDLRANSLIALAVEELVIHIRTLARTLFVDERAAMSIALAGGLMKKGSTLRKRLEHRIKTAVPGGQMRGGDVVPARGAVQIALAMAGRQAVA